MVGREGGRKGENSARQSEQKKAKGRKGKGRVRKGLRKGKGRVRKGGRGGPHAATDLAVFVRVGVRLFRSLHFLCGSEGGGGVKR